MSPGIRRREFLAGLLAATLGAPFLVRAGAADPASLRIRLFKDRRLEKGPLADFTQVHLARHPEESRPDVLVKRLFGTSANADAADLKRALLRSIRGDFTEGRTENIDGWILSVTEIRLWCLYLAVAP